MPALCRGDHDGALLLNAERGHGFGFRLRQRIHLDRLPLAVKPIEFGGDLRGFVGIVFQQQPHAKVGTADTPTGIDARAKQKPKMPGLRWTGEPRHIHQAHVARALAPAQRDQTFGNESAIESDQRHHVGHRAERDIVEEREQIRLEPRGSPEAARAQFAVHRHDGHENKPDGRKMAETGKIVAPVRIDDGESRRQHLIGLMMIDDHGIDAQRSRFRERLDAGGAAIDGYQERSAACRERANRIDVRTVALEQPVGNVDQRLDTGLAQEARQERGRGCAIDVVVAEDRDGFAAHRSRRQSARRPRALR